PALALCLLTVAGDPLRVFTLVAGAFFWLVSLLLASLVWFISVHLSDQEDKWLQHLLLMFGAAMSVLLQEAFRFVHFKLLKRADEGLVAISEDEPFPVLTKQLASGRIFCGGTGCWSKLFFFKETFLTMALVFLHTFWGTIFFNACEKRHYWKLALAVVSHLVISGLVSGSGRRSGFPGFELKCVFNLTFLNPCYEARLIPIFLITIRGVWAFFTAGGSLCNILACLSCEDHDFC
ncbi:Gamma-secretase subunit APH-1A, partial [Ophiophagus hannah]